MVVCHENGEQKGVMKPFLILTFHALMLGWMAYAHSPLMDEPAHLASGLSHWKYHSFDLYRVNPPLVRSIVAIPLLFISNHTDWHSFSKDPYKRAEFRVGIDFLNMNRERYHYLLMFARFFCIPFSILGGWVCYRFGQELFGNASGMIAILLWCFSPLVLAYGYTIMPDVAGASLGITAMWFAWKWLRDFCYAEAIKFGIILGIAQLTKFTLLVIYPICILLLIVKQFRCYTNLSNSFTNSLNQMLVVLAISVLVINIAYGFEGSFMSLEKYEFVSRSLCGETKWNTTTDRGFTTTGNRFRNTVLGKIPVPLPMNYVAGIDVQKKDFEVGQPSYFLGKWNRTGRYDYYIIGLLIKGPFSTWILFFLALLSFLFSQRYRSDLIGELALMIYAITILILVSSQTGLNSHLRYAMPTLPVLFIWISRLARSFLGNNRIIAIVVLILTCVMIFSSLKVYPHSMSFASELIGGAQNGPKYLLGSNIDWGQNAYFLKKWCDAHPEARPIHIEYFSAETPERLGIQESRKSRNLSEPGWYAIGVNQLYDSSNRYEKFRWMIPVDHIGYSVFIYNVAKQDTEQIRCEGKIWPQTNGVHK